ncbi:hypothetical protein S40293_10500 [Stachybotrys chartarum IBT 40293]|nr:hypothetical protein S40293_10500 [Stachybotrys chartarum IBT 40293]
MEGEQEQGSEWEKLCGPHIDFDMGLMHIKAYLFTADNRYLALNKWNMVLLVDTLTNDKSIWVNISNSLSLKLVIAAILKTEFPLNELGTKRWAARSMASIDLPPPVKAGFDQVLQQQCQLVLVCDEVLVPEASILHNVHSIPGCWHVGELEVSAFPGLEFFHEEMERERLAKLEKEMEEQAQGQAQGQANESPSTGPSAASEKQKGTTPSPPTNSADSGLKADPEHGAGVSKRARTKAPAKPTKRTTGSAATSQEAQKPHTDTQSSSSTPVTGTKPPPAQNQPRRTRPGTTSPAFRVRGSDGAMRRKGRPSRPPQAPHPELNLPSSSQSYQPSNLRARSTRHTR